MSEPDYSSRETMERMQQEAMRRVREMQARAKNSVEMTNQAMINTSRRAAEPEHPIRQEVPRQKAPENRPSIFSSSPGFKGGTAGGMRQQSGNRKPVREEPIRQEQAVKKSEGLFGDGCINIGGMKIDIDTILILGLIILLLSNDGDPMLILALLYLLI